MESLAAKPNPPKATNLPPHSQTSNNLEIQASKILEVVNFWRSWYLHNNLLFNYLQGWHGDWNPDRVIKTFMTKLEPITGEEFQSKIALQKADAIVNVTSAWNGAGHMMRPMLEELATYYAGKMKFYTLDYDRDLALSGIYNVTTLPTFLFFQKGTLVDKVAGLINKSDMSVKIQSLIQPTT